MRYRILAILLVLCAIAETSRADVLGTIPLPDGSIVYLMTDRPDECQQFQRVEWRNVTGDMRQVGCFGRHNATIVLMWIDGPAEAVPLNIVRWAKPDEQPVKAPAKLHT